MSHIRKLLAGLLVALMTVPSVFSAGESPVLWESSGILSPSGRAGVLTVANGQEYTVAATESYTLVTVAGRLVVPSGAVLESAKLTLLSTGAIDLTGGNVTLYNVSGPAMLDGTGRHLNLTQGSNLTVLSGNGVHSLAQSNGAATVFDLTLDSAQIANSTLNITGGNGYDLTVLDGPWQTGGTLDGRYSAGGNCSFVLNCTGALTVRNSNVNVQSGRGGNASDGLNATSRLGVKGGGFVNKGDVMGLTGVGGNTTLKISVSSLWCVNSTVSCTGGPGSAGGKSGQGSNGSDGSSIGGNGGGGGGGGGYSSGDGASGAFGSSTSQGNDGFTGGAAGNVLGFVGCGGTAQMNISANIVELDRTNITCSGGAGGNGGGSAWMSYGGGATGYAGGGGGGAGGGAYSAGGGGGGGSGGDTTLETGNGGVGGWAGICGTVADTIACGGFASLNFWGQGSASRNSNIFCRGGLKGNGTNKDGNGGSTGVGKAGGWGGIGGEGKGTDNVNGSFACIIPMFVPRLFSPFNLSHTNDNPPQFTWQAQHDSTLNGNVTGYGIEISSHGAFASPEFTCLTASGDIFPQYTFIPGRYYWRVKAIYEVPQGAFASWSEVWSVDINVPPNGTDIPDTCSFHEDTTAGHLIDLRNYFSDDAVSGGIANYSLEYIEDPEHLLAWADGPFLNFSSPVPDWNGRRTFSVRATDRFGLYRISNIFGVSVIPVNDAPRFRNIPQLNVTEDAASIFNLTRYIYDVDSPVENLSMCASCSGEAAVVLFSVRLLYTTDLSGDVLTINVTDGQDWNTTAAVVKLNNTNDLPAVLEVRADRHRMNRTESAYVSVKGNDEEDGPEKIGCELEYQTGLSNAPWNALSAEWNPQSNGWQARFTPGTTWALGQYSFRARLLDSAGCSSAWNVSSDKVTVLNNIPIVNDFILPVNNLDRTNEVDITFGFGDIEDGANITIEAQMKGPSSGWREVSASESDLKCAMTVTLSADGKGLWSITPSKDSDTGNYSLRIRAVDRNENGGIWLYFNNSLRVLNNHPFVQKVDAVPAQTLRGGEIRTTITGYDTENDRDLLVCELEYSIAGANWTPVKYLSPAGTGWEASLTTTPLWTPGDLLFRARIKDFDEDYSDWSVSAPVKVQNAPPSIKGIRPGAGTVTSGQQATVDVSATDPDTPLGTLQSQLEYRVGSDWLSAGSSVNSPEGWTFKFPVPTQPGTCDLRARLKDTDGNWTQWSYSNNSFQVLKPYIPGNGGNGTGGILGFDPMCIGIGVVVGVVVLAGVVALKTRGNSPPPAQLSRAPQHSQRPPRMAPGARPDPRERSRPVSQRFSAPDDRRPPPGSGQGPQKSLDELLQEEKFD